MAAGVLYICIVALCAGIVTVSAQNVGYTVTQQIADTVISNITCDQNSGYFTITIFNGYSDTSDKTFFVSGQTDGVGSPLVPNPLQVTIDSRQYGTLYLYGPTNTGAGSRTIVGARSVITAWIVDYETTDAPATPFQTVNTVCGNATGPCNCGFFRLGCQLSGGCGPENYAFFWLVIVMLPATVLNYILSHFFLTITPTLRDRDGVYSARANIDDHSLNPVDEHAATYYNKMQYGGTSEGELRAELDNIQSQLAARTGERNDVAFRERQRAGLASNSSYDDHDDGMSMYHTRAPTML